MKSIASRFTSRKFLVTIAAAAAPWFDADIPSLVKVGITSGLAALYALLEARLDMMGDDEHGHPHDHEVGQHYHSDVNSALTEIQQTVAGMVAKKK